MKKIYFNSDNVFHHVNSVFCVAAYVGLYKMIGLTKIDKGSKYGSTDTKKED